ncbi:MAG: hypothetical protein NPIRA06_32060 [Nitrospirales bacterium]|nr:MAG: hypothetical protein NPIRA06_32060 [Nitrospirales bacterium]
MSFLKEALVTQQMCVETINDDISTRDEGTSIRQGQNGEGLLFKNWVRTALMVYPIQEVHRIG